MAPWELIRRLLVREEGADATEYALLVAFIALVIIVGIRSVGVKLNSLYNDVQANVP